MAVGAVSVVVVCDVVVIDGGGLLWSVCRECLFLTFLSASRVETAKTSRETLHVYRTVSG